MDTSTTIPLRSGNKMPVMGLGTWQLTNNTPEAVSFALELGYRMIDTSGDYGTQPGIRAGLEKRGARRSDFYLVTKVEETEDSYEATLKNLDELGLEYADLMLIHRPPRTGAGERLWEGLIRAREEGLTRDIGVSNYSAGLIDRLAEATGEMPAVNQIEWSPFGHSPEVLEHANAAQIVIQAYSPLTRTKRLGDPQLNDIAESHGKTPAQILLRWNLQLGVVPIPKANSHDHMNENIEIFDFELPESDVERLDALNEHYSSLGALPYT
jgi:2,5-diketo-D-gluconate reductase A